MSVEPVAVAAGVVGWPVPLAITLVNGIREAAATGDRTRLTRALEESWDVLGSLMSAHGWRVRQMQAFRER